MAQFLMRVYVRGSAGFRLDAAYLRIKKGISLAKTQSTQRNGFLIPLASLREKFDQHSDSL